MEVLGRSMLWGIASDGMKKQHVLVETGLYNST